MNNKIMMVKEKIPAGADIIGITYTVCTCSIRVHARYETSNGDTNTIIIYSESLPLSCKRGSENAMNKGKELVRAVKDCLTRLKAQMSLSWELSYSKTA
jgi:hypothetical protein